MLETLKIKNLVTFDQAEIEFHKGLNILAGETGAGKSIVIEAIGLILGNRGNTDLIRSGENELQVEALFQIQNQPNIQSRLNDLGFPNESNELIIKRMLSRNGKGRIFVNGEIATLASLQKITDGIIDLCGQHEHQSLTKESTQVEFLDLFGNHQQTLESYLIAFHSVKKLKNELKRLKDLEQERARKIDFLKFQVQELQDADLKPNEDNELLAEKKLLQSSEARLHQIQNILTRLEGDSDQTPGTLQDLKTIEGIAKNLEQLDPSLSAVLETFTRARIELDEACLGLSKYTQQIESDGERLQWVTDRLGDLSLIKKKYGGSIDSAIQTLDQLQDEYQTLMQIQERLDGHESQLKKEEQVLFKAGQKLHEIRLKTSTTLGKSITQELRELKMEDAELVVSCHWVDDLNTWREQGPDHVEFLVQTNRGEERKPIAKIASGGELSRIMLATRRIISDRGGIGVYLFDEIDAGIGGQTAFVVGQKLRSVSKFHQVICITHVPQVASFADQLFSVRKSAKGNRTFTEIHRLDDRNQKEEIARMLGGPKLTAKSIENADELMKLAKTAKPASAAKNRSAIQ